MTVLPDGHSWPTFQWWLSLSPAEQAAWATAWISVVVGLLAAAGGFAAAWASFRAARTAMDVAKIPLEQQERYRLAKAKVVATAIAAELSSAQHKAKVTKNIVAASLSSKPEDIGSIIKAFQVEKTAAMERFFDRFDVFGLDDGILVADAGSAALNFNSESKAFLQRIEHPELTVFFGKNHVQEEISKFCTQCEETGHVIQLGLDVLAKHGAKV